MKLSQITLHRKINVINKREKRLKIDINIINPNAIHPKNISRKYHDRHAVTVADLHFYFHPPMFSAKHKI
jgi:hypothetical protein